jgi:hypothetical protein
MRLTLSTLPSVADCAVVRADSVLLRARNVVAVHYQSPRRMIAAEQWAEHRKVMHVAMRVH